MFTSSTSPGLLFPFETWADALADLVDTGLTRTVGISNCGPAETLRAHAALAARGVPLACNEVEYSLLSRTPERSGLAAASGSSASR